MSRSNMNAVGSTALRQETVDVHLTAAAAALKRFSIQEEPPSRAAA